MTAEIRQHIDVSMNSEIPRPVVRILYVEDEIFWGSIMQDYLKREANKRGAILIYEHQPSLYKGRRALDKREKDFDLVISDWNLGYRRKREIGVPMKDWKEQKDKPIFARSIIKNALENGMPVRVLSGTNDTKGKFDKLTRQLKAKGVDLPLHFIDKRKKAEMENKTEAIVAELFDFALARVNEKNRTK